MNILKASLHALLVTESTFTQHTSITAQFPPDATS